MASPEAEGVSWLRFAIASTTVIGLMGLLAWGLRRMAERGWVLPRKDRHNSRLRIVESLPLDARRRLVLVRCDGTEHLLLLGLNQDIVVATNRADATPPPSTPATSS